MNGGSIVTDGVRPPRTPRIVVEEADQECFCGCGRALAWLDRPFAKQGARVVASVEFLDTYRGPILGLRDYQGNERLASLTAQGQFLAEELKKVVHGDLKPQSLDTAGVIRWLDTCQGIEHALGDERVLGSPTPPSSVHRPEATSRSGALPSSSLPGPHQPRGLRTRRRRLIAGALLAAVVVGGAGVALVTSAGDKRLVTSEGSTVSNASDSPSTTTGQTRPKAARGQTPRQERRATLSSGGRTFSCPFYATGITAAKLRANEAERNHGKLNREIKAIQARYPGGTAPGDVVDEYNSLVDRYNAQLPRLNSLIDRYNRLLREQCSRE